MNLESHGGEIAATAGKLSPPLAVSGMVVMGIPLNELVLIATLIFTVLQIALLVYNFVKARRDGDAD